MTLEEHASRQSSEIFEDEKMPIYRQNIPIKETPLLTTYFGCG